MLLTLLFKVGGVSDIKKTFFLVSVKEFRVPSKLEEKQELSLPPTLKKICQRGGQRDLAEAEDFDHYRVILETLM